MVRDGPVWEEEAVTPADAVRGVGVFASLDPDQAGRLAAAGRCRAWAAGEVLVRAGEPDHGLVIVLSGRLEVARPTPDGGRAQVAELGPGEVFGESAWLVGPPASVELTASRP